MPYRAPVEDFRFLFDHVVGFRQVAETERFAEATPDMVSAILTEAGRMCEEILPPLQRPGDLHPARLENGVVRTSPGFGDGFGPLPRAAGSGCRAAPEHGGMGLPMTLTTAVNEMMSAACLSLQLAPLMSQGQIEALEHHASDEIKALYLPKLISGEWTGTMNLTEPQAGLGCRRVVDQGGTERRRDLPHHRAEDLHLLGRQRFRRECLPSGAGARCPGRPRAPRASACFWCPSGCRTTWQGRRRQQPPGGEPGAQDGPARLAHLRDAVRGRDRLAGRSGERRHGGDVHDDEQRAPRRRRAGHRRGRGRLSACAGLCDGPQAGPVDGGAWDGDDRRPCRCAPDADGR